MHLRAAILADVPTITTLVRAAYAKWVPLIGREPTPMQADYDAAVREHAIELLYDDDDLVGLIETIAHSNHLFIENIAVRPQSQGRGFGRALLAHAEDKARALGLDELRLLTNAAFEANIRLYEASGYRIDRRGNFMGGITVHMSLRI
ncbi:MAG TPA: GNAT family N-acetyltransferase [Caulobacteraceae bacterium]|jgi:ribosomal protein S18 acetylase RimI-like enzyme|nr:GNAT family N-acetyltransferase [Caulobacteraceae bacterium]